MRPHCQKMKGQKCPCHHCQQQHQRLLSKLLHLLFLRQLLLHLKQQHLQQLSRQLLLPCLQHLTHQLQNHRSQTPLLHTCHQHWGWQLSKTPDQLPCTEHQHLCMFQQDSQDRATHV